MWEEFNTKHWSLRKQNPIKKVIIVCSRKEYTEWKEKQTSTIYARIGNGHMDLYKNGENLFIT